MGEVSPFAFGIEQIEKVMFPGFVYIYNLTAARNILIDIAEVIGYHN